MGFRPQRRMKILRDFSDKQHCPHALPETLPLHPVTLTRVAPVSDKPTDLMPCPGGPHRLRHTLTSTQSQPHKILKYAFEGNSKVHRHSFTECPLMKSKLLLLRRTGRGHSSRAKHPRRKSARRLTRPPSREKSIPASLYTFLDESPSPQRRSATPETGIMEWF